MKKALLIAEKPSYMRDIQAAYMHYRNQINYDIDFCCQAGHLVELLDPVEINPIYKKWDLSLLPIDPEKEGGWKYKVIRKSKNLYDEIKQKIESGQYDVIIHAGDTDNEGELLVNLVLEKIGCSLPVLRLWGNSTTDTDLGIALQNLEDDSLPKYRNRYEAAKLRQHTDWLFGMNGSRAIADRIYAGRDYKIAAGRVMTWVLATIVDREDAIKNFVPHTSYGINVMYDNGLTGSLYEEIIDSDGNIKNELVTFNNKMQAIAFIDSLSDTGIVKQVIKKKTTEYAPKLFSLDGLQIEAAKSGYSLEDTLKIIQNLYERHYLTYPRTDCEMLSSQENFRAIISSASVIPEFASAAGYAVGQINYVKNNKKYINDKELAKHGHSAIVPTCEAPDLDSFNQDELFIYKLVAQRFLAIFQPPLVQEKVQVITDINGDLFKSNGKTVLDKGYTEFLNINIQDLPVPNVNENDILHIKDTVTVDKTTSCPKRYTEGTIIDAMKNPSKYLEDQTIKNSIEELHIGTSATRAAIIKKLKDDKYITSQKGVFFPTDFGSFLIHTIRGINLCRADTTGHLEQILAKVKDGDMSYDDAKKYMYEQLNVMISDIKNINKVSYGNTERTVIMTCPHCGKDIMEGPKNFYCTGFRDGCKFSIMKNLMGATFSTQDAVTLFNGGIIEKKLTKADKSSSWIQKLKFDTEEGKLSFIKAEDALTEIECPDCHENLYRNGAKLICHACNFAIWTTIGSKTNKKELSEKDIKYILKHGHSEGKIKGFISSKGTEFSAKIVLNKNGSDSRFEFKFN